VLADVVGYLSCPNCGGGLALAGRVLHCAAGHSFDLARQGYVTLLPGRGASARPATGDTSAMVAAREEFLGAGHYAPLTEALVAVATRAAVAAPGCVVDLGAGPGHHLAAVLDRLPGRPGLAVDASKYAARRAARAHPRTGAVVCDAWRRLPVRTGSAAMVLDVFAPRNGAEIARVLHPDGALVVVAPTDRHLAELVGALKLITVDPLKQERLERTLGSPLQRVRSVELEFPMELDHAAVTTLAGMGPSARHADAGVRQQRIAALPEPVTVTASVTVSTWHRTL
jgi:23S rRNA (guanine745-N1)-methyltransferase